MRIYRHLKYHLPRFNKSSMSVKTIQSTSSTRENMNEKLKNTKNLDKKTFVIAQEIKLAKVLAGNNKTLRERALRRLKRWFEFRSKGTPFTENDFMRIWKGLFYAMWMSDKPLFQEECAEMIATLVHLNSVEYSLMFFKCGLQTLGNEWFGIDQLRLDKFLMFARRLLRQGFVTLKKNDWNLKTIKDFNNILSMTVLNVEKQFPAGLVMHFTEIYLEELSKISEGNLKPHLLTEFVAPFVKQLALIDDSRQINCITKNIFHYLMQQSDIGVEHEQKFQAWRKQGFPGNSIDAMQKEELSDDEVMSDDEDVQESTILDPRAGHVDVILPQLKFIPKQIIAILNQNRFASGSNNKSRKAITTTIEEFTLFSKGQYPLGLKKVDKIKNKDYSTKTKNAVNRLVKFERKLLNKDNKKRKRKNKDKSNEISPKRLKINQEHPTENDLEEFIKKSESTIVVNHKEDNTKFRKAIENVSIDEISDIKIEKKQIPIKRGVKKKVILDEPADKNYECSFVRNSGTWFVYDDDSSSASSTLDFKQSETPLNASLDEIVSPAKLNGDFSINRKSQKRITPIRVKDTPSKSGKSDLFEANEWDVPLKQGETEMFIPSKKNRGKTNLKRRSLDLQVLKNPFAMPATPGSSKKVKIALNLNKSQDIREHVAQIKSSPGIPFDANKKPAKPLLKRHTMSPIDPFYRRKLEL